MHTQTVDAKLQVGSAGGAARYGETTLETLSDLSQTELKETGRFELGKDIEQEVIFLNRVLRLTGRAGHEHFEIEADPRHAEIIVAEMGLSDNKSKTVATPEVKEKVAELGKMDRDSSPILSQQDAMLYRSLTMRAAYLAVDRVDIGNTVKSLSRCMQQPRVIDLGRPKVSARVFERVSASGSSPWQECT